MSKRYGLSGASANVELAKGGPRIKNNSGAVEARNNADDAYSVLRCADGSAANDAVTKGQLDALVPISYAGVRFVAKSGAEHSSIQSAIDSITDAADDNRYAVIVYPGEYAENVVLKNYVTLIGADGRRGAKITATSGTLLTLPSIEAHVDWIDLQMTPTSSSDVLLDATAGAGVTGFYRVEHSDITMSSTAAIQPKAIDAACGVGLYMISVSLNYTMSNTSAVGGTFAPINLQTDNNLFYYLRSIARGTIGASSGNLSVINDLSEGQILCEIATIAATSNNASNADICTPIGVYGGDGYVKQYTKIQLSCAGNGAGDGYALYFDSASDNADLDASFNAYYVSGFANNRRYFVGAGDTLVSFSNRHFATLGDVANGTLKTLGDIYEDDDLIISERIGVGTEAPLDPVHIQGQEASLSLESNAGKRFSINSTNTPDFNITDEDAAAIRLTLDTDGKLSLQNGTGINEFSIDGTLAGNSDDAVPTEQAVKTYVDGEITTHEAGSSHDGRYYTETEVDSLVSAKPDYTAGTDQQVARYDGTTAVEGSGVYIDDDSKVGIGTDSPSASLHLSGNLGANIRQSDTGASTDTEVNSTIEYYRGDNTSRVGYVGFGSSGTQTYSIVNETASGNIEVSPGTNGVFKVVASELQVDGSGDSYITGNVGIGVMSPTTKLDINSDTVRLRTSKTPASASDTGNQGDIAWDTNYIYVCVATDTWKRVAISTW
jgi:hypothetical protein